jgi:hypothetical protein
VPWRSSSTGSRPTSGAWASSTSSCAPTPSRRR